MKKIKGAFRIKIKRFVISTTECWLLSNVGQKKLNKFISKASTYEDKLFVFTDEQAAIKTYDILIDGLIAAHECETIC